MFAVSFAAQAEGDGGCYGNIDTASMPKPATGLETVSTPVATPVMRKGLPSSAVVNSM